MTLDENYAGAFDGRLTPGQRPAVVVVDLVRAYLDPASPLFAGPDAELARRATSVLVETARRAGVPVYWTNVAYRPDGGDGGRFFEKVPSLRVFAGEGAPLGAFPDAPRPTDDEVVVTKQFPSAFFATELADMLHVAGIDTVVIAGYSTSGCVRASTLDALCHGFVPLVVREACADRHPDPHEANLFDLQAKYAEVVGLQDALGYVERSGS